MYTIDVKESMNLTIVKTTQKDPARAFRILAGLFVTFRTFDFVKSHLWWADLSFRLMISEIGLCYCIK
jgi:hypothetical protein